MRGQLNTALTEHQFILYYQPKVELSSGNIIGVEALARWQHPIEKLLAPDMFIDIIGQSSVVHQFTRYIIHSAIIQCHKWLECGIRINVAINISPYNIMDPELAIFLKQQLIEYNVPAELIEIELTENATMVGIKATQEMFLKLKKSA